MHSTNDGDTSVASALSVFAAASVNTPAFTVPNHREKPPLVKPPCCASCTQRVAGLLAARRNLSHAAFAPSARPLSHFRQAHSYITASTSHCKTASEHNEHEQRAPRACEVSGAVLRSFDLHATHADSVRMASRRSLLRAAFGNSTLQQPNLSHCCAVRNVAAIHCARLRLAAMLRQPKNIIPRCDVSDV